MADYTPVFIPGSMISATASVAVTGGQVVEVTGSGTVGPAAAGSTRAIGVAAFDAGAGVRVTVHVGKVVHEVVAASAVAAGDMLVTAANGQVASSATPAAGTLLGVAFTSGAAGARVQYVTR